MKPISSITAKFTLFRPVIKRTLLASVAITGLSSCITTSLSDPTGSGHGRDLNVYDFTGMSANPGEQEIQQAGQRRGSLVPSGSRFLLVQSGASQPDEELRTAFAQHGTPIPWSGLTESTSYSDEKTKPAPGSLARKLRLAAAQQGCSHVVVVFGEIQKDGKNLPIISWVPVASELLPSRYSGMRIHTQAAVMETNSTRFQIVSPAAQETRGFEVPIGVTSTETQRALKLNGKIYPGLASACFGG